MKATIIGAGIGGLTTAIALHQAGIDYEIFEATPELKPVGAGIVMASNPMQVFQRLGIADEVKAAGFEIHHGFGVDQQFKVISSLAVKEKVTPRYGIGSYAIHRWALQQVLLSRLDASRIKLNKRLSALIEVRDKVVLRFDDGTQTEADVVIGADGIKSVVRKSIFGEIPLRYSGQTCWRGIATFTLPEALRNNSYEMWGDRAGLRFGFVPVSKSDVYFFATYLTEPHGIDEPGTSKQKVREIFSVFGETVTALIDATPESQIIRSDINDIEPIPNWWKGRVVLIGDAAHATTPNLGQGGCQAVEDAYVLAEMLKKHATPSEAFAEYQSIRYKKALYVVNTSWRFGQMTNLNSGFLRWVRNTMLRMMPESIAIRELDKILKIDY